jgi:zinc protease
MSDLQAMSVDDARNWYDRWYAPNNAILVVVGNVAGEEVLGLARKYFGAIPTRVLPERKPQQEAEQRGMRRVVVKAPAELPSIYMAFRVPKLRDPEKDWEPYALEVLEGVLSGHGAARLPASLVRGSRIAASAGAGYDGTGRGPGFFMLSATPSEGKSVAEVEAALRAEIARIAKEGISDDELSRVKAQVVASQVFARDSMFAQARQMGALESIGLSHRVIDTFVGQIRRVTAQQVQDVARRNFGDEQLTVAVLDPQPLSQKRRAAPPAGGRH